jgi:hypothetical protein
MRGVHPPVVALLLCVLALPLLVVAATASAHAGAVPARPAAPVSPSSEPPARATALPGAENDRRWYYTDAILELGATVLATGAVAIVVLRRLP